MTELTATLRKKWDLENEPDEARAALTAIILENQDKHFSRLVDDGGAALGESTFRQDLYEALKSHLRTHPLPELCSMQPMTGPIGTVAFYRQRVGEVEEAISVDEEGNETNVQIPVIMLDIATDTITADTRMMKALRDSRSINAGVEELLTEISREILGILLNSATSSNRFFEAMDSANLKEELTRASHMVHRQSQRAAANKIVGNKDMLKKLGVEVPKSNGQVQRVGALDGKWTIYLDPLFPKGQLMAWYQGPSILDTGIIYSPYILAAMTPTFVNPPEGMCVDGALRIRHKITLVRPEICYLVRMPEADPIPAFRAGQAR